MLIALAWNVNEFIESIRDAVKQAWGTAATECANARTDERRTQLREIDDGNSRRKPLLINRRICLISQSDSVGVTDSEIRATIFFPRECFDVLRFIGIV